MDIAFHAVSGIVASRVLGVDNVYPAILVSVLPDVLGGIPYQFHKIEYIYKNKKENFINDFIKLSKKGEYIKNIDKISYLWTHSLLLLFLIIPLCLLLFNQYTIIVVFSFVIHIIIDLFTHDKHNSHQPFYPISNFFVNGRNWLKDRRIFGFFWIFLLVIVLLQWLR